MPEGDTIQRAARALRGAIAGSEIRAAEAHPRTGVQARLLVGRTVREVEGRAKHLLIWCASAGGEVALHTHMGMTGSWHLYRPGQRWGKAEQHATVRLDTDDWVAVCFTAPVCALLTAREVAAHPVLSALGPDLAQPAPDTAETLRRFAAQGERLLLDVLLDQRVFAGVGNVYKSELCFLHGLHPLTPVSALSAGQRAGLVADAARLLRHNVEAPGAGRVTTRPGEPGPLYVYGRGGKPCRRCGTRISSALLGEPARRTAWCPRCQPEPA